MLPFLPGTTVEVTTNEEEETNHHTQSTTTEVEAVPEEEGTTTEEVEVGITSSITTSGSNLHPPMIRAVNLQLRKTSTRAQPGISKHRPYHRMGITNNINQVTPDSIINRHRCRIPSWHPLNLICITLVPSYHQTSPLEPRAPNSQASQEPQLLVANPQSSRSTRWLCSSKVRPKCSRECCQ